MHPLPFQLGHHLHLSELFQLLGELQQDNLTLFLVDDGATTEKHFHCHLRAFLQETLGVVELEFEVVVVGLGTQSDFLDDDFGGLGLLLFHALLLVKDELLVVHRLADWRVGIGLDFNEVNAKFLDDSQGLAQGVDVGFNTLTNQAHHRGFHFLVDAVAELAFVFVRPLARPAFLWDLCYGFSLLC